MFRHVKSSSDLPNRTTQEKVATSRSDCEREDRKFIVDSGTLLLMMSKGELSASQKIPSEVQQNPGRRSHHDAV